MSDDGSIPSGDILHQCYELAVQATQKFGKDIMIAPFIKERIEEAGFVNVVQKQYKWPLGEWPVDCKLKDIGRWNMQHWLEGIDAWTLRLLTQYCGVRHIPVLSAIFKPQGMESQEGSWLTGEQWTSDQVKSWTAQVRSSLMKPRHHAYQTMYVVPPGLCLCVRAAELTRLTESLSTLENHYENSPPSADDLDLFGGGNFSADRIHVLHCITA